MAQITTKLPNGGQTLHFAVSYDSALSEANGLDLAVALMGFVEGDLNQIVNWFIGVNFHFSFPIYVQITGASGGASWTDPADSSLLFGYHPTVVLAPEPNPTIGLLRYLLISEVTEMYMASQGKGWYEPTNFFSGADEGSMGESLSRFLAANFASAFASSLPAGNVVSLWLNNSSLLNFIDSETDDHKPDAVTGCGTCFLFFLQNQLGFSVQQIVAANGLSLAEVYQSLTGMTGGWQAFRTLVQDHYPFASGPYFPPLDNIFPVGELSDFLAPVILSWVSNNPNVAVVVFNPVAPIPVDVTLTSDAPLVISVPPSAKMTSSVTVNLTVAQQSAAFVSETVHLTAKYAGNQIILPVKVVRPEDLPLPPLVIKALLTGDPCQKRFIAASSQSFYVSNPDVIHDNTGLTYKWTVTGASAPATDQPQLTIPILPAAGTAVDISVEIKNASKIHATGDFGFTTVSSETLTLKDLMREVQCRVSQYKEINKFILPWVPIETGDPAIINEQLAGVEAVTQRQIDAGNALIKSIESARSFIEKR